MKRLAAIVLISGLCLLSVQAQVPSLINYQGRLVNGTNLVNGPVGITIRVYDAFAPVPVYECSSTVSVVDGLYSTFIGSNTVYGGLSSALQNGPCTLEVLVNGVALSPREPLGSVGYALLAAGVTNGAVGTLQLASRAVTSNKIDWSTMPPAASDNYVQKTGDTMTGTLTINAGAGGDLVIQSSGTGVSLGNAASGGDNGAAVGRNASGSSRGVAIGAGANGFGECVAVGAGANAGSPVHAVAVGYNITNTIADSTCVRGSLYLDGGTGVYFRSTTGSGTWSPLSSHMPWNVVTGTSEPMVPNNGYLANNSSAQVVLTLPAAPAVGDMVCVAGASTGGRGWKIAQNASQTVRFGGWAPQEGVRSWRSMASSADGMRLVACAYNDRLYTSPDGGVSWVASGVAREWWDVASSSDGRRLIACASGISGSELYISEDYGATWTARETVRQWSSVASSADGMKLLAAEAGGYLYTSQDGGTNWTAHDSWSLQWSGTASSADGTRLVACVDGGYIYTSSDAGTNWTAHGNLLDWYCVAISADGDHLLAGAFNEHLYISNSGVLWEPCVPTGMWSAVTSSDDGTRLAACSTDGRIYVSSDSGATWSAQAGVRPWTGIASSSSGMRLTACASWDRIYTSLLATTAGTSGYTEGDDYSALSLVYMGNNTFIPVSYEGSISGQ